MSAAIEAESLLLTAEMMDGEEESVVTDQLPENVTTINVASNSLGTSGAFN